MVGAITLYALMTRHLPGRTGRDASVSDGDPSAGNRPAER